MASYASTLRLRPSGQPGNSNIRNGQPQCFNGRQIRQDLSYSDEWQQYIREEIHSDCPCFELDQHDHIEPPDVTYWVNDLLKLEHEVKSYYKEYKRSQREVEMKLEKLTRQILNNQTPIIDFEMQVERQRLEKSKVNFESKELRNTTKAYQTIGYLEKTYGLRGAHSVFRYMLYPHGVNRHWPFICYEEFVSKKIDAHHHLEKNVHKAKLESCAGLLLRLYDDGAEAPKNHKKFQAERYGVYITKPLRKFMTQYQTEIEEVVLKKRREIFKSVKEDQVERLKLCKHLGISVNLERAYSAQLNAILKYEGRFDTTYESLVDSLYAMIMQEKKGTKAYEEWKSNMRLEHTKNLVGDDVHEKIWQEFWAPMVKYRKYPDAKIGTAEGFMEWKQREQRGKMPKKSFRLPYEFPYRLPQDVPQDIIEGLPAEETQPASIAKAFISHIRSLYHESGKLSSHRHTRSNSSSWSSTASTIVHNRDSSAYTTGGSEESTYRVLHHKRPKSRKQEGIKAR